MDHFETLELLVGERTRNHVKAAYHRLVLQYHPDKRGNPGEEISKRLNVAYNAIMNGELYDPDVFALPQNNKGKRDDEESEQHLKTRKTHHDEAVTQQRFNDWRTHQEEESNAQKWNEATRRIDDVTELQFTRTSLRRKQRDLLKNWRDDAEHRDLLTKYQQRIAVINVRVAEIEAERRAEEERVRQKWEDDMLRWDGIFEVEAAMIVKQEEETREQSTDDVRWWMNECNLRLWCRNFRGWHAN